VIVSALGNHNPQSCMKAGTVCSIEAGQGAKTYLTVDQQHLNTNVVAGVTVRMWRGGGRGSEVWYAMGSFLAVYSEKPAAGWTY